MLTPFSRPRKETIKKAISLSEIALHKRVRQGLNLRLPPRQSDTLLTKSEQDLLAFIYGDKFDDSLGIRNTVLHISNCGYSEDDHK